jgi:uncharacterized membrane protein
MTVTATPRPLTVTPRGGRGRGGIILAATSAVSAVVVIIGAGPLILRLVAGMFLLICLPVLLVNAKINWPESTKLQESLLYSLAFVVLALMLGGLAINEVLPFVGVARPLDRVPVVVTLLVSLAGLAGWRRERWRWIDGPSPKSRSATYLAIGKRDQILFVVCAILVVGSVAGSIRLNNGAGEGLTTAMLFLAGVVIVALFSWRRTLNGSTIALTIYLMSLAFLLMTSLRGWFVIGDDSQIEFGMFRLASDQGVWNIGAWRHPYNACLSVTIFPTIIERTTGIPDAYIYKVALPVLFALCPMLIYLIARRFTSTSVAILGVVFFIALPVYWIDMVYMLRQEVAFFFLGVALLLVTDSGWTIRARRIAFVILGIGILLSHYSTTYVLLGVLIIAWMLAGAVRILQMLRGRRQQRNILPRHRRVMKERPVLVLNWAVILTLTVLTFLWVGPVTHTTDEVEYSFISTVNSLTGNGSEAKSPWGSYIIFGGAKQSRESILKDYRDNAITRTEEGRKEQQNYPLSEVNRYPTPLVGLPPLHATALGKAAKQVGVNVTMVRHLLGGGLAMIFQLFVGLEFVLLLLGREGRFIPSYEFLLGAVACIAIIELNVLLPYISTRYGTNRVFFQALFWLAPFIAAGSMQAFSWLGQSASMRIAAGIAVVFFLVDTEALSLAFGGEPQPTMPFHNFGPDYEKFYLIPQEVSGVKWMQARANSESGSTVQSEVSTGIYSYSRLRPLEAESPTGQADIFPALIHRDAYVFLGDSAAQKHRVTIFYEGDLVTYHYPIDFLDNNKSLVYSSDGARVYR